MALIDKYSKEEIEQIVQQSTSLKEVIGKLGYNTQSGHNNITVKKRIADYGIDTSHFARSTVIKRNEDDIFVKNSTASQATLRRWYKKGEYSSYICSICGQEPVWNGKELTLILDHIDGENHNNEFSNLRWVCPNCNQQLETTGYKKMRTEKLNKTEKKYYCLDCGKEIGRGGERCIQCSQIKSRVADRPCRQKLKEQIRSMPFTQIGKIYNVSDNAIRKWCDSYGLPRKVALIKQYSNEEWELI